MKLPVLSTLRPTNRLLVFFSLALIAGLLVGFLRVFIPTSETYELAASLWLWSFAALAVIALIDAIQRIVANDFRVKRVLPNSFALNRPQNVTFEFSNLSNRTLKASLSDALPQHFDGGNFPLVQHVGADQVGVFEYSLVPKRRGLAVFEPAYLLLGSTFGLWDFLCRAGGRDECKVYPDFTAVSSSFMFGVDHTMRNMGAHIAKRKGDGLEFNQLREFREGDTLKQVDWKATAKLGSPISREYQEEKDQNVVFLLDCSRRMRAMEKSLSYFDYALNALLISSYIALDKGDAVGVMTFSGEPSWMPPIKGKTSINTILNHLYALATSTQSSDYVSAAEDLLVKHRKRSLVILITNVRDEDKHDLQRAVDILSQQHLVMVVALQERLLNQADELPLQSTDDFMLYSGVKYFEHARSKMLALLKASGVSVVDATHKNIHVKLVTEYLRLKQFGQI